MSMSKSALKALIIHEVGIGFEGLLEQVQAEHQQVQGAINFASIVLTGVEDLQAKVQQRIGSEEGGLDIEDAGAINKNYQTVYNYIADRRRALLAQAAEARGRLDQAEKSRDFLKKLHDAEAKKAEAGPKSAPPSLKAQRQSEEAPDNGAHAG